jgi:hypothetical protein
MGTASAFYTRKTRVRASPGIWPSARLRGSTSHSSTVTTNGFRGLWRHWIEPFAKAISQPSLPAEAFPFHDSRRRRTDILKAAGGFSPTRDNAEDVDLCLRLGTAPGFVRLQSPPLFAKLNHTSNIGLQSDLSTNGLREIHRRERAGIYPGGASRERARLALILVASRQTILEAVYWRKLGLAWSLYRRCFFWNLRLGEWKFAFKLPPLVMFGYCRKYLADYLSLLRGMVRLHTLERRA